MSTDPLDTALVEATPDSPLRVLAAPRRGTAPPAVDLAPLARAITQANPNDPGLPGLVEAYRLLRTGSWDIDTTTDGVIDQARRDYAAWQALTAVTPPEDLATLYWQWDGVVQQRQDELESAQSYRRLVLLALNQAGRSMRELADMIGVRSHNAVAKTITQAKQDVEDRGSGWARKTFLEGITERSK